MQKECFLKKPMRQKPAPHLPLFPIRHEMYYFGQNIASHVIYAHSGTPTNPLKIKRYFINMNFMQDSQQAYIVEKKYEYRRHHRRANLGRSPCP